MLQQHRWSSLPDDIIAKIISHLNFPRPRSPAIWISGTTFRVDYILDYPHRGTVNISELWKILDNLFTIFITPSIDTFIIFLNKTLYEEPCVRPILNSWTRRLRACNTQHITINSVFSRFIGGRFCPPSVFQIKSLVSLDLACVTFVSHYPVIILPNLKKLSLGSVSHEFLGRLLSSCPSLEDLSFSLNDKPKGTKSVSVSISSKILKRLHIMLNMWLVPGDIELIIDAPTLEDLYFSSTAPLHSMRMIGSISNLKSLELVDVSMKMIYSSPTMTIYPFVTKLTLSVSSSMMERLFIFGYGIRSSDDYLDKDQFYENLLKFAEDTSRCEIKFHL